MTDPAPDDEAELLRRLEAEHADDPRARRAALRRFAEGRTDRTAARRELVHLYRASGNLDQVAAWGASVPGLLDEREQRVLATVLSRTRCEQEARALLHLGPGEVPEAALATWPLVARPLPRWLRALGPRGLPPHMWLPRSRWAEDGLVFPLWLSVLGPAVGVLVVVAHGSVPHGALATTAGLAAAALGVVAAPWTVHRVRRGRRLSAAYGALLVAACAWQAWRLLG